MYVYVCAHACNFSASFDFVPPGLVIPCIFLNVADLFRVEFSFFHLL